MTLLSDIILSIRERTDTVNNPVVSDAELASYANASFGELDDIFIESNEDYRLSEQSYTMLGPGVLALPANCYKVRGVDYVYDTTNDLRKALKPFVLKDRNVQQYMHDSYGRTLQRYRVEDSNIVFAPAPIGGEVYVLLYTPSFTPLALSDSLPYYMDFNALHEYVITDVGIKVLQKQELDPSVFMSQKESLKVRVKRMSANRDTGAPKVFYNAKARRSRGYSS